MDKKEWEKKAKCVYAPPRVEVYAADLCRPLASSPFDGDHIQGSDDTDGLADHIRGSDIDRNRAEGVGRGFPQTVPIGKSIVNQGFTLLY